MRKDGSRRNSLSSQPAMEPKQKRKFFFRVLLPFLTWLALRKVRSDIPVFSKLKLHDETAYGSKIIKALSRSQVFNLLRARNYVRICSDRIRKPSKPKAQTYGEGAEINVGRGRKSMLEGGKHRLPDDSASLFLSFLLLPSRQPQQLMI